MREPEREPEREPKREPEKDLSQSLTTAQLQEDNGTLNLLKLIYSVFRRKGHDSNLYKIVINKFTNITKVYIGS